MALACRKQGSLSAKRRLLAASKALFLQNGVCLPQARHFFCKTAFACRKQAAFSAKRHLLAASKPLSIRKDIVVSIVSLAVMSFRSAVRPSPSLPGQAGVDVYKDNPFFPSPLIPARIFVPRRRKNIPAGAAHKKKAARSSLNAPGDPFPVVPHLTTRFFPPMT